MHAASRYGTPILTCLPKDRKILLHCCTKAKLEYRVDGNDNEDFEMIVLKSQLLIGLFSVLSSQFTL